MKYFNPYYWLRKIFVSNFFQSFFFNKDILRKLVFKSIYKSNHWNAHRKYDPEINSVSGTGSNPKTLTTINLVKKICEFINNNNINEIVDAPCGDCAWVKEIWKQFPKIKYQGIDIVDEIVESNKIKYEGSNIRFACLDILKLTLLPKCDLLILRDFIIHLPIEDINILLNLIKKSQVKLFAINSYSSVTSNTDVATGKHRKINLFTSPFNLSNPIYKFKDQESEFCIFINK